MVHALLISDADRQALDDPRRHRETLTRLSAEKLAAGDGAGAFMFADRRCRLGGAQAHDLLLRSESLRLLGRPEAAEADLARAAACDPTDPHVTLRLIEAGGGAGEEVARWAIADPRAGRGPVEAALRLLLGQGRRLVGSFTAEGATLSGWAAWRDPGAFTLRVWAGDQPLDLDLPASGEARDGLRPHRAAVACQCAAPPQRLELLHDGVPCPDAVLDLRVNPVAATTSRPPAPEVDAARAMTVIVPVYDDIPVTRRCLDALAAQRADGVEIEVVVVDDAVPDPAMKEMVAARCRQHGFRLVASARNLGFTGAVNLGLAQARAGDVVFLNADVVLPPEALAKLARAAAQPGVGIVNPITNNGQFNSFPSVLQDNAFLDDAAIAAVDQAAGQLFGDLAVPTPGAIGYCMYVTQACLAAVGPMPDIYLRGYYEDVEFSLRAAAHGFAAVCLPGCYVGHQGSASFKGGKQRLVSRNERVNDGRFPLHSAAVQAFRRADPLRGARAALEEVVFPLESVSVVLAGGETYRPVLEARRRAVEAAGDRVALLTWEVGNGVLAARLQPGGAPTPRERRFRLDGEDAAALRAAIEALRPARLELAGAPGALAPVLDPLLAGGLAFGALVSESLGQAPTRENGCLALEEGAPCAACVSGFDDAWRPHGIGHVLHRAWAEGAEGPALVVAMDDMAAEIVTDLVHDAFPATRAERCPAARPAPVPVRRADRALLAIPCPEADATAEALVARLAATLLRRDAPWHLLVLGAGRDARRLMSTGTVFVTGPVREEDAVEALAPYGAAALLAPRRWSGYGLAQRLAAAFGLPKAYFDWSVDAVPARGDDLSIDPRVCDAKAVHFLSGWLDGLLAAGAST